MKASADRKTLEKLLAEARRQEREVMNGLKTAPCDVEQFDQLLSELDTLQGLIVQLKVQLAGKGDGIK